MDDMTAQPRRVSIVLFDGFELLDVFGPVELMSMVPDLITVDYLGPVSGPVASSQGVQVIATTGRDSVAVPDIVLVPGGPGTRQMVNDEGFVEWLRHWAEEAELVTSVCTGSALLAAAGLLDGHRATSNKAAFDWVREYGRGVDWIAQARWVEDGDRWTSSGVAAGMDMTAALLAHLFGSSVAEKAAMLAELDVHGEASWDPFAAAHGLTGGGRLAVEGKLTEKTPQV